MSKTRGFRGLLATSASVLCFAGSAWAQTGTAPDNEAQAESSNESEIVVTATRRESSVLAVPFNIAAISGDQLLDQGIRNIADIGSTVPGLHIVNQGQRDSSQIVVRGLALETQTISEIRGNSGGGTVSTYVGEVPLYIDMRLNDIQRVEVLLGPQGTLYGAGSLGGTIRYIVNKPDSSEVSAQLRTSAYGYSDGNAVSYDAGATVNLPLIKDKLAFRASLDYLDDQGYMNAPYLVRQLGVSQPDIVSGPNRDANLYTYKGINGARNLSGRAALRLTPNDWLDATVTYYYQRAESDGRNSSGARGVLRTGKYENPFRVMETSRRENQLVSFEATADLGFADLTSATGYSKFDGNLRRDQTDINALAYASYRAFPAFVAYGDQVSETENVTQELRLVSKGDGPLSYIVGGFYGYTKSNGTFIEHVPGLPAWFGLTFPNGFDVDYASGGRSTLRQISAYGELTYRPTEKLSVTGGLRYYDYGQTSANALDLPIVFRRPSVQLTYKDGPKFNDNGTLFKANVSYQINPTTLTYFTFSQGYRTGYTNNLVLCSVNPRPPCAQPDELDYRPDKTNNFEVGLKGKFLDNRLLLSSALYYVKWQDPQITSRTLVGSRPITKNGEGAESKGFELGLDFRPDDRWHIAASYSYVNAELTEDAPRFDSYRDPVTRRTVVVAGLKGDRLPSSPEHQGYFAVDYTHPISDTMELKALWSTSYTGDILTSIGNRRRSITLPDYSVSNFTLSLLGESYSVDLFVYNIFDAYIETSARQSPDYNIVLDGGGGRPVYYRSFTTDIAPPRQFGVRFTKNF